MAALRLGEPLSWLDPWAASVALGEAMTLLDSLEDRPGADRIGAATEIWSESPTGPIQIEARPDGAIEARRMESAKTTAWER